VTVVDEWHVTGDPTVELRWDGEEIKIPFPPYHFVYRSDDSRWCGAEAEQAARGFVERCSSGTEPLRRWRDGPHLFHRTVTYSDLAPVPVETETPR
jgi:hypothetical protein